MLPSASNGVTIAVRIVPSSTSAIIAGEPGGRGYGPHFGVRASETGPAAPHPTGYA
jgi:hypothetical protein